MSACCTFFVLLESASEEGRYYFIELISCMYVVWTEIRAVSVFNSQFIFSHSFYILFVQKGICTYEVGLCIRYCKDLVFSQPPVKKDDFYMKQKKVN